MIGVLLGLSMVVSQQCFILFIIFASTDVGSKSANVAMAVFCLALTIVYSLFGLILWVFRKDIQKSWKLELEDVTPKSNQPTNTQQDLP